MSVEQFYVGQKVYWEMPRKYHGITTRIVPVTIVDILMPKRITIEVKEPGGETKIKHVKRESLRAERPMGVPIGYFHD